MNAGSIKQNIQNILDTSKEGSFTITVQDDKEMDRVFCSLYKLYTKYSIGWCIDLGTNTITVNVD